MRGAKAQRIGSRRARLMRYGFASTHPTGHLGFLVRWFVGLLVARARCDDLV